MIRSRGNLPCGKVLKTCLSLRYSESKSKNKAKTKQNEKTTTTNIFFLNQRINLYLMRLLRILTEVGEMGNSFVSR